MRNLTNTMSESVATALDCTETNNIGDGAESAGGGRKAPAETDKYGACGVCRLILPTIRCKSQHERLVHPEWYHGTRTT